MKISYCDNTWGGTFHCGYALSRLNVRCDSLHDEILIRLKGIGIV